MSKERPILMSGPMVRACLRGMDPKSQTRRAIKPQPHPNAKVLDVLPRDRGDKHWFSLSAEGSTSLEVYCPYGRPGDRLWVRETFNLHDGEGMEWKGGPGLPKSLPKGFHVTYAADCSQAVLDVFDFRPSIHMPRWASRIMIEIDSVRAERLHDLSEHDAMAEGVEPEIIPAHPLTREMRKCWRGYEIGKRAYRDSARESFSSLWNYINGRGSWDANPWVWAITYKRIAP